jgi:hypothetical protein
MRQRFDDLKSDANTAMQTDETANQSIMVSIAIKHVDIQYGYSKWSNYKSEWTSYKVRIRR